MELLCKVPAGCKGVASIVLIGLVNCSVNGFKYFVNRENYKPKPPLVASPCSVNAQGQTAYRMLMTAAWEEQYIPGPNLTYTFAVPVALKRVLRSLLRRYAPVLA